MDLSGYKAPVQKSKHPNQVLTDEIMRVTGEKDYRKWVMRVALSKKGANEILDICKTANELPDKYNKAGYIWKRL